MAKGDIVIVVERSELVSILWQKHRRSTRQKEGRTLKPVDAAQGAPIPSLLKIAALSKFPVPTSDVST